jgi:hypothetical protein
MAVKNAVFWDVTRRVALVRVDISEEYITSLVRMKKSAS